MVMVLAGRTISMTAISISTARVGEGREAETKKPYYGSKETFHRQTPLGSIIAQCYEDANDHKEMIL